MAEFNFTQAVAATTWTIEHNMDAAGVVMDIIIDNTGTLEKALPTSTVETDSNTITVTFPSAQSGYARLIEGGDQVTVDVNWSIDDISLSTYDSKSYDVNPYHGFNGMYIKADGLTMFLVNENDNKIYQHSMSTAWDISTSTFDGEVLNTSAEGEETRGIEFKPDGTKMYILKMNLSNIDSPEIEQYTLSTAWDVSTATPDSVSYTISEGAGMSNIRFSKDGDKLFMPDPSQDSVRQYSLATDWDISTASYDFQQVVGSVGGTPRDSYFNPTGDQMILLDNDSPAKVWLYDLSAAFTVNTAILNSTFDFTFSDFPVVLGFSSDGSKMFVGDSEWKIYQYSTNI